MVKCMVVCNSLITYNISFLPFCSSESHNDDNNNNNKTVK